MFHEHVYEMKPNIFFSLVSLQGEGDGKRVGRKGERGRRIFQTGLQGLLSLGHSSWCNSCCTMETSFHSVQYNCIPYI